MAALFDDPEAGRSLRIFLAGGSGVIGRRLIPRLVQAGHVVGGMTRSPGKTELLADLGAEPILCDVFDRDALVRTEGTRNLIAAARRSGFPKILAQSVAWQLPDGPGARAVAELERSVLAEGGVVLRYGHFYGPGTYHQQPPAEPRVHIDRAAERTVQALDEPPGVLVVLD